MYLAWNTLSLVHVMEFPTEGKEPGSRMMFIDSGMAATGISDLSPDVRAVLAEHPDEVGKPSMIAYVDNAHPKILIISSSAGEQVLDVLKARASSIASSTPTAFLSRARKRRCEKSRVGRAHYGSSSSISGRTGRKQPVFISTCVLLGGDLSPQKSLPSIPSGRRSSRPFLGPHCENIGLTDPACDSLASWAN